MIDYGKRPVALVLPGVSLFGDFARRGKHQLPKESLWCTSPAKLCPVQHSTSLRQVQHLGVSRIKH